MNELIFLGQSFLVFYFTRLWTRVGKEALFVWMGFLAFLANFFVTKQISLFGLEVTASDVYMVGLFFSLNIIQEYGGITEGKRAVKYTFLLQIAFLALSQLHLLLQPNNYDSSQHAFETILGIYPRILASSVVTLWVVQQWDLFFFNFLKQRFTKVSFSLRSTVVLIFSQALDTVLFSVLALWGEVGSVAHIILMSFIIKCGLIALIPLLIPYLRVYELPLRNPSSIN